MNEAFVSFGSYSLGGGDFMNKWLERLKAKDLETESKQILSFKTVKTAKSDLKLENDRLEPESFRDQVARQTQG